MSSYNIVALTCPNCALHFNSREITLTPFSGRRRTDFQPQSDGHPALCLVHACDRCGFAGRQELFLDGSVSYEVRRHVWDELAPRLSNVALTSSEKYEFAAKVALWEGAPPREVADLWLCATWSCVDEGDAEAERYFRLRAARAFEDCLAHFDGFDQRERTALTYLVGELWRRIGDLERSREWFQSVAAEAGNQPESQWLVRWAKQQLENPREWFS